MGVASDCPRRDSLTESCVLLALTFFVFPLCSDPEQCVYGSCIVDLSVETGLQSCAVCLAWFPVVVCFREKIP